MYRFLLTPRWIGGLALAVAAAAVMVFLGVWQLHRYEERTAINNRIDSADAVQAVAMESVMTRPSAAGSAGPAPGQDASWTKVTVTGQYDVSHEIQARARTVNGDVGFEIVTPLVLADGTAVLVDRGWIAPQDAGAEAAPVVPPAPGGEVTVVGQIHLSESRTTPIAHRDGRLDTRRITVSRLAHEMPYPTYGAYVLLTQQTPPSSPTFVAVPIDHEDSWQNAGYTVQWWLFAAMALFAFVWQARKEAQDESSPSNSGSRSDSPSKSPRPTGPRPKPTGDRVEEADRRTAAAAKPDLPGARTPD